MADIIGVTFVIACFVSLVLALVSLFRPKTAFFLARQTRARAMGAWLGIGAGCFAAVIVMAGAGLLKVEKKPATEPRQIAAVAPEKPAAEKIVAEVETPGAPQSEPAKDKEIKEAEQPAPTGAAMENDSKARENAEPTVIEDILPSTENAVAIAPPPAMIEKPEPARAIHAPAQTALPQAKAIQPERKTEKVQKQQAKKKTAPAASGSGRYSGNVKTYKFHRPGCRYYDCNNCVRHFTSREQALKAGYVPCQKCGG